MVNSLNIALVTTPYVVYRKLKNIENISPPLGVGYLASVLEKNRYKPVIIESYGRRYTHKDVKRKLEAIKPDIVGISTITPAFYSAVKVAKIVKMLNPKTLVIVGGPHVTALPYDTMRIKEFDIGVYGEGEYTILELAKEFEKNKSRIPKNKLKNIKGILYREKNRVMMNPPRPYIENLDSIPFPALYLYPSLTKYKPTQASYIDFPQGTMMTSRGCPYNCIFCDKKVAGFKFRARSPKNVVDEMEQLVKKYGAKDIKFWDDTFSINKKRVFDICDEIEKRGLKINFGVQTRVDCVTLEMLKRLKQVGCWQVCYGFESGSQKVLNTIGKRITLEQSRKATKWSKMAGLDVRGYFVFGLPEETLEDMKKTINFALSLDLDMATFYTFTPYPGCAAFEMARKQGKIKHTKWENYHLVEPFFNELPFIPEGVNGKDIDNIIKEAYRKFYLRPSFIFKKILEIKNVKQLHYYFQSLMAILGFLKPGK